MLLWYLIVLAVVQGITEFLPVSSSAHLALVPWFVDMPDQGIWFDIAVHVGSLGAVVIYFWRDVWALLVGVGHTARRQDSAQRHLLLLVVVGSLPIVVIGAVVAGFDLLDAMRRPAVIAVASIFFGIVLWRIDETRPHTRRTADLDLPEALKIGCAQVLALIPGTSRSGITITAGRYLALDRREAARFSMLLALPAVLGSGVVLAIKAYIGDVAADVIRDLLIAGGLALVAAWVSIGFMMWLVGQTSYKWFVVYRVALGVLLLGFVFAGILPA